MAPKKFTATSSKRANTSKRARVDDPSLDPTNLTIPPYPERLSTAARKWVTGREHLKLIIGKAFVEHVIEHLGLNTLFGGFDWNHFYTFLAIIILNLSICSM